MLKLQYKDTRVKRPFTLTSYKYVNNWKYNTIRDACGGDGR